MSVQPLEWGLDLLVKDPVNKVTLRDRYLRPAPAYRRIQRVPRTGLRFALALLLFGAGVMLPSRLNAQEAQPDVDLPATAPDNAAPQPNPLDLNLLLADPVEAHPEFQQVRDLRHALAAGAGSINDFEALAERLASLGAFTTAIEVLWFAERMQPDKDRAAAYRDRMREWAQAATPAEMIVEESDQLLVAGRQAEAVEALLRALQINPLSERARFRLADAWRLIYQAKYEDDLSIAPLEIRVRIFRDAYEHYQLALEIDPLFYDAYYGLSELRNLFPENNEFLLRSQPMTQRALDFRAEVLPVLQAIEAGREDAALMTDLGLAFEAIGVWDYAIYAYRCALGLDANETRAAERLESLRTTHFASP